MNAHFDPLPLNPIFPKRLASALGHPSDILDHPELTRDEKRTILAAWASDARAVEDAPSLR